MNRVNFEKKINFIYNNGYKLIELFKEYNNIVDKTNETALSVKNIIDEYLKVKRC